MSGMYVSSQAGNRLKIGISRLAIFSYTLFNIRSALFECTLDSFTVLVIISPKFVSNLFFLALVFGTSFTRRYSFYVSVTINCSPSKIFPIYFFSLVILEPTHTLSVIILQSMIIYLEIVKLRTWICHFGRISAF